jgi:hypothetical protein
MEEVLDFLNVDRAGGRNTLLIGSGMKLETMPLLEWCFLGLLWSHFPCSLGLLDLDLAVVRSNNGAILPLERGNSDRLVDRCCWLSIKSELDRGFHFWSWVCFVFGGDFGECHGGLIILDVKKSDCGGHGLMWGGGGMQFKRRGKLCPNCENNESKRQE